jgi:hypothetical protein
MLLHLIPNLEWSSGILAFAPTGTQDHFDVFNEYRDVRQKALDRLAEYAETQAGKVGDFSLGQSHSKTSLIDGCRACSLSMPICSIRTTGHCTSW